MKIAYFLTLVTFRIVYMISAYQHITNEVVELIQNLILLELNIFGRGWS